MAITTKNRKQLKAYFVKNAIPTEGNFSDLVDAQLNQAEDGVFKLPGEPLSVVAGPGEQRRALRFYSTYPAANPDWQISLAPAQDPGNPASVRQGFGVSDGAGQARLFIDRSTGNVGVGTNNPGDRLTVSGGDLRIEGAGYHRLKVFALNAGVELVATNPGGTPHIDFTQGLHDNLDYGLRLIATDNKVLHVQSGLGPATLRVQGDLEVDGLLARLDVREHGSATVRAADLLFGYSGRRGAPGRALVDNKDALVMNFAADWSRVEVQSPLTVHGALGIGTPAPEGPLDVRVAGVGGWDRFVVTASDAWNNGNQHVTIGTGGAGGIMINNPHVSWIAGEKRASIRYGQSLPSKAWWDVGLRENDAFTFVAAGSPTALAVLPAGDVSVTRDLDYGGQLGKLDVKEQGGVTLRAADLLFGHSGRRGAPGRALVDNKDALVMNFAADWSRVEVQSPLTVHGALGIGTPAPEGPLDVRVAGAGGWDRLVVTASDAWNNGNQHVTIGAGGAAGIMINNPHVSWIAAEKRASIRYGQSLPSKAWWDVGLRENDAFTFIAAGSPTALAILPAGDVSVARDLDYGGQLGKLDVKEQGGVTLRAADLLFGHSGRRGAPGRALVDGKDALIVNFGADWTRTEVHGPLALAGNLNVNGDTSLGNLRVAGNLELNGQPSLGFAQTTGDFNQPLRSGFYQFDNPAGRVPDTAHSWVHMISVRHANPGNNHQLQIAASYAENDKLYFRKIARELAPASAPWHELATVTDGVLRVGGWSLEATATSLIFKCGAQIVARFSTEHDRFQVYRNVNGQGPYFYYNSSGQSGA